MKTTIEIIKCDECNKKIEPPDQVFTFNISIQAGSIRDLCWSCLKARVKHSFDVMPASKCKTCDGKGKVREPASCAYDKGDFIMCPNCSGKGKVI
jgi:hypothetical protein